MSKKTILYLYIPGIILAIAAAVMTQMAAGSSTVILAIQSIGGILVFISWIGALVATAKMGRWGWFCVVLLLSWLFTIGELIYLIAGPSTASAPAAAQQG